MRIRIRSSPIAAARWTVRSTGQQNGPIAACAAPQYELVVPTPENMTNFAGAY
jgi:hypothetical protein